MKVLALLVASLALLSACSTVATHKNAKVDLSTYKKIYVEARLGDDHGLDLLIVRELQALGYEATSGPMTMKPDDLPLVVFYEDRWAWDFKSYLIEFNLTVRDVRNDVVLATGSSLHPSMIKKTPAEMIHEIVPPIFKRR